MIKQSTLKNIRDVLENHPKFNSTDFSISTKDSKVIMKYEYEDSFLFEVEIPNKTTTINKETKESQLLRTVIKDESYEDYKFRGKFSPGNLTLLESFELFGEHKFYKLINSWLDNLWNELLAIPVNRQFEDQAKVIQEIKDRLNDIPDTYFEFEEAEEIKRKIDHLENQFQEKLDKEIQDKAELKKRLDELHKEFANLKETIHSVKRNGWFKSFFSKTFTWVSKEENRKFLNETKDFIYPMLPDNIKNILP